MAKTFIRNGTFVEYDCTPHQDYLKNQRKKKINSQGRRGRIKGLVGLLMAGVMGFLAGCSDSGGSSGGSNGGSSGSKKKNKTNSAPVITTTALPEAVEGIPYKAQLNAKDKDGDNLTYFVSKAPTLPNLEIDSNTGQISLNSTIPPAGGDVGPTDDDSGQTHSVTFAVKDNKHTTLKTLELKVINTEDTSGIIVSYLDNNEDGELDKITHYKLKFERASDGKTYELEVDNSEAHWEIKNMEDGDYKCTCTDENGKHLPAQLGTFKVLKNALVQRIKMLNNKFAMIPNDAHTPNFPAHLRKVFANRVGWTDVKEGPRTTAPKVVIYTKDFDGTDPFAGDETARNAWVQRVKNVYLNHVNTDKQNSYPDYQDNANCFEVRNEASVAGFEDGKEVWKFDKSISPSFGENATKTSGHKKLAGIITIKDPSIIDETLVSEAFECNGHNESEILPGIHNNIPPTLPNKYDKAIGRATSGSLALTYDVNLGTLGNNKHSIPLTRICNRDLFQTIPPATSGNQTTKTQIVKWNYSDDGYTPEEKLYGPATPDFKEQVQRQKEEKAIGVF